MLSLLLSIATMIKSIVISKERWDLQSIIWFTCVLTKFKGIRLVSPRFLKYWSAHDAIYLKFLTLSDLDNIGLLPLSWFLFNLADFVLFTERIVWYLFERTFLGFQMVGSISFKTYNCISPSNSSSKSLISMSLNVPTNHSTTLAC